MEQLAERYAKLKGTVVLASKIEGNSITFILASGPKLTMSTRQLEEAIAGLEDKAEIPTAPPPRLATTGALIAGDAPEPPKRKGKKQ